MSLLSLHVPSVTMDRAHGPWRRRAGKEQLEETGGRRPSGSRGGGLWKSPAAGGRPAPAVAASQRALPQWRPLEGTGGRRAASGRVRRPAAVRLPRGGHAASTAPRRVQNPLSQTPEGKPFIVAWQARRRTAGPRSASNSRTRGSAEPVREATQRTVARATGLIRQASRSAVSTPPATK